MATEKCMYFENFKYLYLKLEPLNLCCGVHPRRLLSYFCPLYSEYVDELESQTNATL